VDISYALGERLTRAIDLPADIPALRQYLDTPLLEDEKIPLRDVHINSFVTMRGGASMRCTRDHLLQLFRPSQTEEADAIATLAKAAIGASTPPSDSTECAYIYFWDMHMASIIHEIISEGHSIRDSNKHTDTASLRPDYGYLYRGICTFRGEEKRLVFSGTHPKDELIDKLVGWVYDPAPYVLGKSFHSAPPSLLIVLLSPAYYAVGPNVTLAAITPHEVVDLAKFDLVYRPHRVACIVRIIKLCRLLKPLQEVIGYRTDSEFVEIKRHFKPFFAKWIQLMLFYRENGSTITIGMACVQKTYTRHNRVSRIRHLRNIYDILKRKNTPNVDSLHLAHDDDPKLGSVAYLSPRGINKPPSTGIEVTQAILCVLNALTVCTLAFVCDNLS
jgi:hypothetical protein